MVVNYILFESASNTAEGVCVRARACVSGTASHDGEVLLNIRTSVVVVDYFIH